MVQQRHWGLLRLHGELWMLTKSPLVLHLECQINASAKCFSSESLSAVKWRKCAQRWIAARIIWNKLCGSILFVCGYGFELCQAPTGTFRYHQWCIVYGTGPQADRMMDWAALFSSHNPSSKKEIDLEQRTRENGENHKNRLSLYSALMRWCVILSGAF